MNKQLNEETKEFQKLKKEWIEKSKKIETKEQLDKFVKDITENYIHDYGTYIHMLCAVISATLHYYGNDLTGFQASLLMWEVMQEVFYCKDAIGMKLIKYEDMLYPQYEKSCDKIIDRNTWICLQKEAKKLLKENKNASPIVINHWKSIIDGVVPFGYKVKEN